MNTKGTLIFFCGKMAAGKSTRSVQLADEMNTVLLSEDQWLSSLYPDQIHSFDDYLKYSAQIKPLLEFHVQNILNTGTSVVMDFPANTATLRTWFLQLCAAINAPHKLVYLQQTDEQCLSHLAQRRITNPERAAFDTEAMFHQVTRFFEEPEQHEGLVVELL